MVYKFLVEAKFFSGVVFYFFLLNFKDEVVRDI